MECARTHARQHASCHTHRSHCAVIVAGDQDCDRSRRRGASGGSTTLSSSVVGSSSNSLGGKRTTGSACQQTQCTRQKKDHSHRMHSPLGGVAGRAGSGTCMPSHTLTHAYNKVAHLLCALSRAHFAGILARRQHICNRAVPGSRL